MAIEQKVVDIMATSGARDGGRVLYGVPIQDAIAGGDLTRMKEIAAEAETYLGEHADISAAYEALKAAIIKADPGWKSGRPLPPYGVAIHNAIASGDLAKMRAVAAEAQQHLSAYGNVGAAVEVLNAAIAKAQAGRG